MGRIWVSKEEAKKMFPDPIFQISEKDAIKFFEAMDNPPEFNEKFLKAYAAHHKRKGESCES
jgi:uncharacterized protein (DUF1778 family)